MVVLQWIGCGLLAALFIGAIWGLFFIGYVVGLFLFWAVIVLTAIYSGAKLVMAIFRLLKKKKK